ncbi:GNAT family N-acetyltransferase [Marinobacterium stanieri]|uniref:Ribosomal protein S18 acetylase RimI n=1 Tax=Marinobacterium stanieri TaxID=49186 RepID=A0A1N6N9A8_9GAMM|nr:GNAT family N-acetyltransferase [Marinobacterium stanieri]SIP88649.1 Ribosomal protein S18 acetylase RimI [Marinobacterium stanieri]
MLIREVREEDVPEICKLPTAQEELFYCFPKSVFPLAEETVRESILTRTDSTVIEAEGRIVAFANFYHWGSEVCAIGNVVVKASHRGCGIARLLIRHMIELGFDKHGTNAIKVSCFNRNAAGLLLYAKLGFQPCAIEQRTDYNGERVALVHFQLQKAAALTVR